MPVHWSEDALADLEALRAYVTRHSERGAGRVVLAILAATWLDGDGREKTLFR